MSDAPGKLVPLRIRLPYKTEEEFIERYGSNVARGGIFIATRAIKPEGTGIAFEFVLEDGARLMRGEGVVQKTQVDEGGSRAGMTVRFMRLDPRSKALIDRVIAHRTGVVEAQPPEIKAEPAAAPLPEPATPKNGTPRESASTALKPGEVEAPALARSTSPGPLRGSGYAQGANKNDSQPPRRRVTVDNIPIRSEAKAPAVEEVVLGIDLGTTNARVAIFQDGAAKLVQLGRDGRTFAIPSVVALDEKGNFLVGARAKAQILADPKNTVYGAKRLLGRRARSRKIRELSMRFPYPIVPDEIGDAGVNLRGKVFGLPEVMAMLLKELRHAVQEQLAGREVTKAVLCVPAYFNDHQRAAMLDAGKKAGLEVLRILNEPSAVALAFGYGKGLARKRILVYDLGGGTFDASVVELTGDDLEVVTTGGDNFLGGLDFDLRMAEELQTRLPEDTRARLASDLLAAQRIRDAAETAKISLSDAETVPVHVPYAVTREDGSPVDLHTDVTRATLEDITQDLVDRTVEVTEIVLEAGNLKAQSLDEILLVGGQSRAPLVKRRIEQTFGKKVRDGVDPHGAVAIGAALLGHSILLREQGKRAVTLSEVLSAPIGIAVKGGAMKRVLEKNTRLPAEKTISFPVKGGTPLGIAVFQGTSQVAEENEYLGALHATADKGGEVVLRFAVNPDGKLDLSATGPLGRKAEVTLSTSDASDEVRAALLAQAPLPGDEGANPGGLLRGIKKLFGR